MKFRTVRPPRSLEIVVQDDELRPQPDHNIASCISSVAIHFRDVKIGVKKIERMSVKNLISNTLPSPLRGEGLRVRGGILGRFSEDTMIFRRTVPLTFEVAAYRYDHLTRFQ